MTPQRIREKNTKKKCKNCSRPASQPRVHTASSSVIQLLLLYEVTTTAAVHDEVYVHQYQHTTALLYAAYSEQQQQYLASTHPYAYVHAYSNSTHLFPSFEEKISAKSPPPMRSPCSCDTQRHNSDIVQQHQLLHGTS